MLARIGAGSKTRQPHLPHQSHNTLAIDLVPLPLEPDRHPPASIKGRYEILPVNQLHQTFVFRALQPGSQRGVVPRPA